MPTSRRIVSARHSRAVRCLCGDPRRWIEWAGASYMPISCKLPCRSSALRIHVAACCSPCVPELHRLSLLCRPGPRALRSPEHFLRQRPHSHVSCGRPSRGTAEVSAEPEQTEALYCGVMGWSKMEKHVRKQGHWERCRCAVLCLTLKHIFLRRKSRSCQLRPILVAMMTYRKVSVSWRWSSDTCCMGSGRFGTAPDASLWLRME